MKFTDEELSRILSAAAIGGLKSLGTYGPTGTPACLVQAARSCFWLESLDDSDKATWFDSSTSERERTDPDAMLRALEQKGWA